MQRKTNGQFKKGGRLKSLMFWIVVAGFILWGGISYQNTPTTLQEEVVDTQEVVEQKEVPLNEQDALKIENFKKKVVLERKRADEESKHNQIISDEKARNESVLKGIETEMEALRKEELSFMKATPQQK